MTLKNIISLFLLLFSTVLFSQKYSNYKAISKAQSNTIYLDSIKKTFVKDHLASRIDSMWLHELTNLDLYNDLASDIKNVRIDDKVDYELSTELLKERLDAMDAKSPFAIEYNVGLENLIKSFLKNRSRAFGRLMGISEYYFPIFEEALANKNVPLEIKYLAIVESALNPKAVSKMGATGLWQFMYQTGKQYKLKIDSYVDERGDPVKSSEAAAQYMSAMYEIFGDWDLVLASYNSGPGNVAKAIRRSGGQQNYWNIRKHLPQETQGYVPAFLATMYIYEYHKEHGIKPEKAVLPHFATDTIRIKKQISFKQLSDLLDVPVALLQLLNPSYKLNVIPAYDETYNFLRLPKDKISIFTSNEPVIYAYLQHELDLIEKPYKIQRALVAKDSISESVQGNIAATTKFYAVKRGDKLSVIANKYGVTIADIKKWNGLKSNFVAQGKSLKIMTDEAVEQAVVQDYKQNTVSTTIKNKQQLSSTGSKGVQDKNTAKTGNVAVLTTNKIAPYIVQKGDNLTSIAKECSVTVAELKDWNKIIGNSIQLGMSLQVAKEIQINNAELVPNTTIENVEYIVKKGDNLGNIAAKFGSTIDDIKLWNKIVENNIALGSSLIVAKSEVAVDNKILSNSLTTRENTASVLKNKANDYLVQKGDSLYSISKKYPGVSISDIKKWNNINNEDIKPGMKLKLNG